MAVKWTGSAAKRAAESPQEDVRKQPKTETGSLIKEVCSALLQTDIRVPFIKTLAQLLSIIAPSALEAPREQRQPQEQLIIDLLGEVLETSRSKLHESTEQLEQDMHSLRTERNATEAKVDDPERELQAIHAREAALAETKTCALDDIQAMLQHVLRQERKRLCMSQETFSSLLAGSRTSEEAAAFIHYVDKSVDCDEGLKMVARIALVQAPQTRNDFQRRALEILQQTLIDFEVELAHKEQRLERPQNAGGMEALLFQQPFGQETTAILQRSRVVFEERRANRLTERERLSKTKSHYTKVRERISELANGNCTDLRKAGGIKAFIKQSFESLGAEDCLVTAICPALSLKPTERGNFDNLVLDSMQEFMEAKLLRVDHELEMLDTELASPPKEERLPLDALDAMQRLQSVTEEAKATAASCEEHEEMLAAEKKLLEEALLAAEPLDALLAAERKALFLVDETISHLAQREASASSKNLPVMHLVLKLVGRA